MKPRTPILALAVTLLAACGAPNVATGTKTPRTNQPNQPTVTVPDLNDPATRHRFICSFGPGSFGTPIATTFTVNAACEDLTRTGH
jgi:hypothetical protein